MNFSSFFSPLRLALCHRFLLLTLICIGSFALSRDAFGVTRAAVAAQADVSVNKSGDESAPRGGLINYSLSAFNAGPDDATNVVLVDQIPAHTTFVSASTSQGTVMFNGTTVTVNFGTLPTTEGASATLVVSVNNDTPRGTTISNTASVTSNVTDPDTSNNSATALTAVTGPFAGDLLISEFRVRGPNGANDEFIEIYNNSGSDIIIAATDGSDGYGIAASNGVVRCTITNGTRIPNGGHFLCVNSVGYSLASYPAGNDTTATGDATYTTDIPDNAGIALFNTANPANFTLVNRLDAVGSTSEANTLYKEGTGYPALTPFSIDYSFYRDDCGKGGSIPTSGPCTISTPKDTDNNATDFVFVDTNGTSAGAGQRLGAPGPQNLSSPVQSNSTVLAALLDASQPTTAAPNRVRDFTSAPAQNSTFGTLDIRRRIVNGTGLNVTRLRFRVMDITTFPAPSGIADLRPRTSTSVSVSNVNDAGTCNASPTPCTVTVQGTTLEQPPSQPNGGGFNSSLSAGTITLGTPLAPGESINVRFLLGIQQTGNFRFFVNIEALAAEAVETPQFEKRRATGLQTDKTVKSVKSVQPINSIKSIQPVKAGKSVRIGRTLGYFQ